MKKQQVINGKGTQTADRSHALLSASSSHRWIRCPPSARLCENFADKGSDYAKQGSEAHSLCQFKLESMLGIKITDPTADLSFYDEEMEDCAENYALYVMEQVAKAKETCADPVVLIEQRLDFSRWVESGFGTGDCVIIADGTLSVIDYKHGKGILVEAENNPQMLCYSLGAVELFDGIFDFDTINITIYQPRRENISTFTLSKAELLQWADDVLAPAARLAYAGEGEFESGEHCYFCKAKATCRKRAECNLELARYDFAPPATLEDEEIEAILLKVDDLVSWASDVKAFALQAAISGKEWAGWKLVEGRANRKYIDETAVAEAVVAAGVNPYEHKLLGITAMTSILGKKRFEKVLGQLICRPQGKPTLVPESDKRPAMNTAKNDFIEE
ncbi:DUF2800 domain-containing protein [uncultured Acetobacterium sp.]|uniref:DUF2800 domain-containing protein n=1 Tax=uncultured Acetobacterium sp. TaxID=217139 RepID=UPI0025ED24D7|nr:DUF2800 domain-containing protein [uncultured Acetobacterium sp.]